MAEGKYYDYDPSLAAAVIFAVLFGITTMLHIYQMAKSRTWYFIPYIAGGLFETFGYTFRSISIEQKPDYERVIYILQLVLILLAPALYAASIYMVLGRLILLVDGEHLSLIRRKWLTKIFVCGDVVSFLVQVSGGAMQSAADAPDQEKRGRDIVVAGLFVQIVIFSLFIIVIGLFHKRITQRPTTRSRILQVPWLRYIYVLYTVSALIMIRSIFRVIEYIQGREGELMTNEVYFYVLDTVLMFIVSGIFNFFHPSSIIARGKSDQELDSMQRLGSQPVPSTE